VSLKVIPLAGLVFGHELPKMESAEVQFVVGFLRLFPAKYNTLIFMNS
jgi:hypothetical protein